MLVALEGPLASATVARLLVDDVGSARVRAGRGLGGPRDLVVVGTAPLHPPSAWVLLLEALDVPELAGALSMEGCRGVLTSRTPVPSFVFAIRLALEGHRVVGDDLLDALVEVVRGLVVGQAALLGQVDVQLLGLAGRAEPTVEIARQLGISESAVRRRFSRVYAKLGVHTRGEAMLVAMRLGILASGRERPQTETKPLRTA